MSVSIVRSTDAKEPSLILCVYGPGGVGKTTLATTAPNPIIIDSEQGSKALGARGIDVPIINVSTWMQVFEAWQLVEKDDKFKTIVIDPVDRFLDLLIEQEKSGGDMTLKKWGNVKERMRKFLWTVKDSGKHIVLVAHEAMDKDDDQQLRKPKLQANLSDELVDLCDVVGHLRIDSSGKRVMRAQPEPKYRAKDRYDALGEIVDKPNITDMVKAIHAKYNKPPFEPKETKK